MRHRSALLSIIPSIALLVLVHAPAGALAASAAATRRQLQVQQQQDALTLDLQQSIRARRYDLGPADERSLGQLQLQQRLQQQLLEQQQRQQHNLLMRDPAAAPSPALDARAAAQRESFAQERQLQIQRFDMEQQRLLDSARTRSLQAPSSGGALDLP